MFGDGSLTFREFMMHEPLPLASIHAAVLEFLQGRDDAVLFGAQAVNAYVDEPRMTQDVVILSPRAADLAEELRADLNHRFSIAVRIRTVGDGIGFRLYQVRKPTNRHLVDVRTVTVLPPHRRINDVLVLAPAEVLSSKVVSMVSRSKSAKGVMDLADIRRMLLAFPELKTDDGPVARRLQAEGAAEAVLSAWREIVSQEILAEDEDAGY
jgi:hypothetical protein